jgi:hypothetical protein
VSERGGGPPASPAPAARTKGRRGPAPQIAWPIWAVMCGGFGLITGILLWFGSLIVVRCERVAEGRVDVIVQQRLLGLLPVRTERLADVVRAGVERKPGGPRQGNRGGPADPQLRLVLRDGRVWYSQPVRYAVGTLPRDMAPRIQEVVDGSSAGTLRFCWLQWIMATLSVPFLLVFLVFVAAGVNMARRQLRLGTS